MLSVIELFQEREEWMGQEEEVVEERREVGCQWERPEEERKDVGCQSDSAERRDVAVQVDLLAQQLCGMAWRCVAVRAGEPGGGALLQRCGTPGSRGHTLYNALLPIMPLCGAASRTQPESTDIQWTVPLPSTPPADSSAAPPPPGLIAPLSPRLAEEEEEEDEGSSSQEISDGPVRVDEQSVVTVETKTKREHPGKPKPISPPVIQRRSRRRRSDGDKINQSEERRNVRIKTRHTRRNIQTGCFEAQRKHTRAEGGEDKNMEAEKENEKLDEVMKEKRKRRRSKVADGLTPVKMNSEVTDRPRRKAVGPPIRYLLEYEERSGGKSVANHEKGRGLRGEEEKGRKEDVELQDKRKSSREVGGGMALKQLHLSIYRKGSCRRGTTIVRLRRLHHHSIRGHRRKNTSVSSGTQSVDGPEEEIKGVERRVQKRRSMEKDRVTVRNRRRRGRVVRRRRLEEKLSQRPRRTMVGPPIRYLLESEKTPGGLDVTRLTGGVTKPQKKKTETEGEALADRTKATELTEKQTELTNQDAVCSPKRRVGSPKKVSVESEAVGGASGRTNLTVKLRRERRLQRKGQSGRRSGDRTMELKGGEEEREVKEFPQRPRRMMVGPPIRYLLESEKTHGQETANQDVARLTGGVTKPQKKKTETEGEALADRTKATELTEKQTESTNQDAACSPKCRVGSPEKDTVDIEPSGRTKPTERERDSQKRKGGSERRSGDQTKEEGGEEERQEEVKKFPQRPRRTMVGPPLRYLLESEKTHGQERANQDVARGSGGVTKPQNKKTGADVEALADRTKTTELTEKQTELTNQDAARSPKCRLGIPKKVKVESEAVGGASVGTKRDRHNQKRKGQSEKRSGDQTKEEGGEEEEVKEFPQSQRRTMVGPLTGHLLKLEERSHDWEVTGSGWGLTSQEETKSGGGALKQETAVIDRPEDTEQKVRQADETATEIVTSLINPDGPKSRRKRRRRRPVKVRGQREEGGGASEVTGGTKIEGQRQTQRSERKRKMGTEEVRRVCVNDREEERMENDKKTKQTGSSKRPRRTMVGPPIRYLLESEEQSHGRDTTNHGFGCMRKLLEGNEAGLGAVEDTEGAKRRAGTPRKVGDDSKTGGGASERQTDIRTQTSSHTQSDLIYFDPQSGQVTIFSPCCVRLQHLL